MRARCAWLALALIGLMGFTPCAPKADSDKSARSASAAATASASASASAAAAAKSSKGRPSSGAWRVLFVLGSPPSIKSSPPSPPSTLMSSNHDQYQQQQLQQAGPPRRVELQKAWEDAIQELAHTDVELAWVEQRPEAAGAKRIGQHPTALIDAFCGEVKTGKTALVVMVGGGPAMRFLLTATTTTRLPTLWMPYSNRDFVRQGKQSQFESRVGSGSEEIGAAAGALMTKAHWRAFTLLIDPTLLTLEHLVPKVKRQLGLHPDVVPGDLVPRRVIYLPQHDEKSLGTQLRRVADENGRGSVVVLACDLSYAKKIITIANKHEMLAGRFLWLWLDLKAELKPSEPNIIGTHILNNARVSFTSDNIASQPDGWEFGPNFSTDNDFSVHTLSNMASEVNKMQEYLWHSDVKDRAMRSKRSTQSKSSSPATTIRPLSSLPTHTTPSNTQHQARSVPVSGLDEDDESVRYGSGIPNLNSKSFMPLGMLALRAAPWRSPEPSLGKILRETARALERAMLDTRHQRARLSDSQLRDAFTSDCFEGDANKRTSSGGLRIGASDPKTNLSRAFTARMRESARTLSKERSEFQLLNLQGVLVPGNKTLLRWAKVGTVKGGKEVRLDTIIWPGGGIVPAYVEAGREKIGMPSYKIVTALAPPFAMVTNLQEGTCLRGLTCKLGNAIKCCYGYSMDILDHASKDLEFRFDLHVVKDGLFGRRRGRNGTWNGVIGELLTGKAQMAFAPLSVYSHRSQVVDFSTPYYFSSVSFLIAPKERNEISLTAFLQPFSTELWIAVFTSLNITAMFVAAYEWFSPFGLNPWGRQRSKNFSIASALWVTWGLLCGHLVAFKAPKSWPNKFLINVWGGFSVIFVASYTANIAALIAGLFFHSTVNNYYDRSLLLQKVAAPRASAAEYYVQQANPRLWSYMSRYSVSDVSDGVRRLLNGSLDILIADTPIIDYYRLTDNGCRLEKIGTPIKEDTYAVAMAKGHPMKESISKIIANYSSTGLLDILQEKWYSGLPCTINGASGIGFDGQPKQEGQPRPLGVASVAGVFCMLGLGMTLGIIILIGEHIFYKYSLPKLRKCPKDSVWRSPNVMFFSQKLYRFINCVDLVSPHHAARELVHTVRQGQITSLFQKSVKRKEHEQHRRRKSKAQFFEMIQEIRRAQQEERLANERRQAEEEASRGAIPKEIPSTSRRRSRSRSKSPMPSPRGLADKRRSSAGLAMLGIAPVEYTLSTSNLQARSPLELVGRRLSGGNPELESPPLTPKLESSFGGSASLCVPQPYGNNGAGSSLQVAGPSTSAGVQPQSLTTSRVQSRSPAMRGQSFPTYATLEAGASTSSSYSQQYYQQVSRSPLLSPHEMTSAVGRKLSREWGSGINLSKSSEAVDCEECNRLQVQATATVEHESRRRKKSHGDVKPVRRARSHENKDYAGGSGEPVVRFSTATSQVTVGGGDQQQTKERNKRKLESELKAILSARAHHFELHPP